MLGGSPGGASVVVAVRRDPSFGEGHECPSQSDPSSGVGTAPALVGVVLV